MNLAQLQRIYAAPLFDLIARARATFLAHWKKGEVQLCTLLSIKTGGCSEDCAYCAQSARYRTGVRAERLLNTKDVLEVALARSRKWVNAVLHGCGVERRARRRCKI
jgi:biotin synthase